MKLKLSIILSVIFVQHFVGCSSSSVAPPVPTSYPVEGAAVFGAVSGGSVSAYPLLSNGDPDIAHVLASANTDSEGKYILNIPRGTQNQAIVVQLKGGSYVEEASGNTVKMGTAVYTSVLPFYLEGNSQVIAISPFTEIAYQIIKTKLKAAPAVDSTSLGTTALNVNYQVSTAFGLGDIVGTLPATGPLTAAAAHAATYSTMLVTLSKAAQNLNTDSVGIANAYAQSFLNSGSFPTGSSSALSITDASGSTVSVTPPTFSALSNLNSQIGSGSVQIAGFTPPTQFVAPALNASPPATAPTGYTSGGGNIVCVQSSPPLQVAGQPQTQSTPVVVCQVRSTDGSSSGTATMTGTTSSTGAPAPAQSP